MGIAQSLDSDAPTWAQQLFNEFQVLREEIAESRRQNQPPSLRVGTAEAAIMLNKAWIILTVRLLKAVQLVLRA